MHDVCDGHDREVRCAVGPIDTSSPLDGAAVVDEAEGMRGVGLAVHVLDKHGVRSRWVER